MDLVELCERLSRSSAELGAGCRAGRWPAEQLQWCAEAGVFRWFVPKRFGGWEWNEPQQLEGYLALSKACLTTAFVLTQWNAACKRIAMSANTALQSRLLPAMADGSLFATVGISHLTTSRQHVSAPVLSCIENSDGSWTLDGFSPWVTGGAHADVLVVGATQTDGKQILCAVPRDRTGVKAGAGADLIALAASATDRVEFERVNVQADEIIAGPKENVMHSGVGGGAGGLQTSTLAIGLTLAAVEFLQREAIARPDLSSIANKLAEDAQALRRALMEICEGDCLWTSGKLREQVNSLVLRATQSALVAAKGAGFVDGHPAGRWCREALFFLVWSCPQPVLAANLCEFAQV